MTKEIIHELQFRQPFWVLANNYYYKHIVMQHGIDHFYSFISDRKVEISVPDGCIDIICCLDKNNPKVELFGSVMYAELFQREKGIRYFGVRFQPGVFKAFRNIKFSEIPDEGVDLLQMTPVNPVWEQILCSDYFNVQIDLFVRSLMEGSLKQEFIREDVDLFNQIVMAILESRGTINTKELMEVTNYSERRIRSVFAQEMGMSIKQFRDIVRFQNVLSYVNDYLYTGSISLAKLAMDMGYYDQAHMSNQFKKYSKDSPAKYCKRMAMEQFSQRINIV